MEMAVPPAVLPRAGVTLKTSGVNAFLNSTLLSVVSFTSSKQPLMTTERRPNWSWESAVGTNDFIM
eukprot:scaffold25307_cov109-Isochrysis_galbana.AAC.9